MADVFVNYNSSLANSDSGISVVLEPGGRPILRPVLRDEGLALNNQIITDIPGNIRAEFQGGRFYFDYIELVEGTPPDTTISGEFIVDENGNKVPLYVVETNAVTDSGDTLFVRGWIPGSLASSEDYINALKLATIRLGGGNDSLLIIGDGISQEFRSEVSPDRSFGYIFQSNIFGDAGDDYIRALMPWQSTFKGGTNTDYSSYVLRDSLTVEELPGDVIELKGSRFDWDLEFRHVSQDDSDPSNDQDPTLASYLDGTSYIATSNNNKIYEFERILFGDILLDVVIYKQLESGSLFGQPEYYLNGVEDPAATLNSTLAQGSELWEAFRFNRTILSGIAGSAAERIDVYTGDAEDTPYLVGALQFANLYTESDHDTVELGSTSSALVDLGLGNDVIRVNGSATASEIKGDAGADTLELDTIVNTTVTGGLGDDVVWVKTASGSSNSIVDGGDGSDLLKLAGTLASYSLSKQSDGSYQDGFGSVYKNFEAFNMADGAYASSAALDAALAALASSTGSGTSGGSSSGGGASSGGSSGGSTGSGGTSSGGTSGGASGGGATSGGGSGGTTTSQSPVTTPSFELPSATPLSPQSTAEIQQVQIPGGGLLLTANPSASSSPLLSMKGSSFNDVITGTFGSQLLDGNGGADELTGGPGADVFRLSFGDRDPDVVLDFTKGEDKIEIGAVPRGSVIDRKLKGASQSRQALQTVQGQKLSKKANSLFAYDADSGNLFFNANLKRRGFGAEGGKIAELPFGLKLDGRDLQISYVEPLS